MPPFILKVVNKSLRLMNQIYTLEFHIDDASTSFESKFKQWKNLHLYVCLCKDFVILICKPNTFLHKSTCKFKLSLLQICLQVCQLWWSLERWHLFIYPFNIFFLCNGWMIFFSSNLFFPFEHLNNFFFSIS